VAAMSGPFLLIAALSGRAAATAAWRAGYAPLVADLFADRDTRAVAAGVRQVPGHVETGFDADTLLPALEDLAAQAEAPPLGFVYGAGFEDRPQILAQITARWPLLGNSPDTVAAVNDPAAFAGTLARLGVPHPEIRAIDEAVPPGWLIKRQGGAGGGHVTSQDTARHAGIPAQPGSQHPPGSCRLLDPRSGGNDSGRSELQGGGAAPCSVRLYRQRRVTGRSVSALFVSGAGGTEIVGFSEQWTCPAPGQPFRFGGAVCPADLSDAVAQALGDAVQRVAGAYSLRGLNSADFVVGPEGWWLLEINSRLGATLDIFDTPGGALMQAHLAAVHGGPPVPVTPASGARGMQVVYAPRALRVAATDWPGWTADRPHPGERIPAHGPLCTILATGNTPCEVRRLCLKRSNDIQELMGVVECRTASAASLA
jgi:predicted ATP-grasp superfamily ATP-dependent carboligase